MFSKRLSKHNLFTFLLIGCLFTASAFVFPASANACTCYDSAGSLTSEDYTAECISACLDPAATVDPAGEGICSCPATSTSEVVDCRSVCANKGLAHTPPTTNPAALAPPTPIVQPTLGVRIPGLTLSTGFQQGGYLTTNFIADYISGLYRYLIGISVTIAIVFVMIGGLQYVLGAGGQEQITKGKERITNAVAGLVLLLGVYVILYTVNPSLVFFEPITLKTIDPEPFVLDNLDFDGAISFSEIDKFPSIICPKQTGVATIPDIVKSFEGKVTYRFGGKGGPPPYEEDTQKIDGRPTKDFCPVGQICLDCSGFINVVKACAGYTAGTAGTSRIFVGAEEVVTCTDTSVNGVELQPGDIFGWRGDERTPPKKGGGHVLIYIGGGQMAESNGTGRAVGGALRYKPFSFYCNKVAPDKAYRVIRLDGTVAAPGGSTGETGTSFEP